MTLTISKRIGKVLILVLAGFAILILGVAIGSYPENGDTPKILQCPIPTEDSCHMDHIGKGRWILIQDHP